MLMEAYLFDLGNAPGVFNIVPAAENKALFSGSIKTSVSTSHTSPGHMLLGAKRLKFAPPL
jgi:hypothetical protein